MLSSRHEQLIDELEATATRSYLEEVLLACLLPLRDGRPTSWDEVTVHDAWVTDDYLAVIYTSPRGPKVGVVHTEISLDHENRQWSAGTWRTFPLPSRWAWPRTT